MRFPQHIRSTRSAFFFTVLLLAAFGCEYVASSQVCSGCEVSRQTLTMSDARLNMNAAQKTAAESIHLFAGRPIPTATATNEHMIHQLEWITWYDDDLRVPLWVAYKLTRADLRSNLERQDCFRKDPRLNNAQTSECDDYNEPTFDQGHMVPSADMTRGRFAMTNTFIFSNMCPQHDRFNRGVWARLEDDVRRWAVLLGHVYVITGAVFDRNGDGNRDPDRNVARISPTNRVAVPTHFYKIILHVQPKVQIYSITILLPHVDRSVGPTAPYLSRHITSIDHVEQLTGINFFPQLPNNVENAIEAFQAPRLWNTQ